MLYVHILIFLVYAREKNMGVKNNIQFIKQNRKQKNERF